MSVDAMSILTAKGYETGEQGHHVLELSVTLEKIDCVRLSEKATEKAKSNYKVNVSLKEKQRRPDGATLAFSLEFTGSPQLARITVAGTAELTGSPSDVKEGMTSREDKSPPKVVEMIYEKLYGLIYSMAGGMKVPYPMPNLLKKSA